MKKRGVGDLKGNPPKRQKCDATISSDSGSGSNSGSKSEMSLSEGSNTPLTQVLFKKSKW